MYLRGFAPLEPALHKAFRVGVFQTTSPQGDGNCARLIRCDSISSVHFQTTSPQGDGNY